jgi:hypothetical protein
LSADELDLVARLAAAEALPPEVADRAEATLRRAIAAEGDRRPQRRRRTSGMGVRLLTVTAAVAAVAAGGYLATGSPAAGPGQAARAPHHTGALLASGPREQWRLERIGVRYLVV